MNRAMILRLAGYSHFDDYSGVMCCETGFEHHGELHHITKN